jgi:hypothetical protein
MTYLQRLTLIFRRIFAPATDLEIENTVLRQRMSWLKSSLESMQRTAHMPADAGLTLHRIGNEIEWALDVDDQAERTPLPASKERRTA